MRRNGTGKIRGSKAGSENGTGMTHSWIEIGDVARSRRLQSGIVVVFEFFRGG